MGVHGAQNKCYCTGAAELKEMMEHSTLRKDLGAPKEAGRVWAKHSLLLIGDELTS